MARVPTATVSGYHAADTNMDGISKYTGTGNDRDPILREHRRRGTDEYAGWSRCRRGSMLLQEAPREPRGLIG